MDAAAAIACQRRIESGGSFCSIDPVSCIVSRPTQLCGLLSCVCMTAYLFMTHAECVLFALIWAFV